MPGTDGDNVWNCICLYRVSTASEIVKLYGNDHSNIVGKLNNSYSDVKKYHGHGSGSSDSGTNPSADTNLNSAIKFLKDAAPSKDESGGQNGTAQSKINYNKMAKANGIKAYQELRKILSSSEEPRLIKEKLDERYEDWENNEKIASEFKLTSDLLKKQKQERKNNSKGNKKHK